MKILICDDDALFVEQIEKNLVKYEIEHKENFEIDRVNCGTKALEMIATKNYELLFLDIEMPELNGVEVGERIRTVVQNYQLQIVYVSTQVGYALELFQNNPFDFLIKPVSYEKIEKMMDKLFAVMGRKNDLFTYQKKGQVCRVKVGDILYFESNLKKSIVVTEEKSDEFYSSLKDIYEILKDKKFFYCHKSILVNYDHVSEFYFDKIVLDNGEELEISQAKRKEVRNIAKDWVAS